MEWNERVLVVQSPAHAKQQTAGLEARLETARKKIEALTPPRGKGRRQISDEAELLAAIAKIIEKQRVEGLLNIQYEKEVEQKTKYVGRGRGSANREKVIVETIRYQITSIEKDQEAITEQSVRFGWKAFVTEVTADTMSLHDAVLSYRNEYRVERIYASLED